MVKLLGSILILVGGFWARWSMVSVCRRELDTLSELTACLSEMTEEIRQARTPLPELLDRLGRGLGGGRGWSVWAGGGGRRSPPSSLMWPVWSGRAVMRRWPGGRRRRSFRCVMNTGTFWQRPAANWAEMRRLSVKGFPWSRLT